MVANHQDFPAPSNPHREGWHEKTERQMLEGAQLSTPLISKTPNVRDVALRVEKFLEDNYGGALNHPNVSEGLWLAMQLVGGPQQAAAVMRYCGVNFADK